MGVERTDLKGELPGFDTPRLAEAVERLAPERVDALPFGAIRLDAEWQVTVYNDTERRLSGFRPSAVGRPFFTEIAPCMDNPDFRGRIERARAAGRLDIDFGYVTDLPNGARDVALHVRIQSASDGGCWIFFLRED